MHTIRILFVLLNRTPYIINFLISMFTKIHILHEIVKKIHKINVKYRALIEKI